MLSKPLLYFSNFSLIYTTSTAQFVFLYTYQVQEKTKLSLHYSSLTTRWQRPKVFSTCHKIRCWGEGHWPICFCHPKWDQAGPKPTAELFKNSKGTSHLQNGGTAVLCPKMQLKPSACLTVLPEYWMRGYRRIISAASPAMKPSGQISRHQNHSASQLSVK